MPVLFVLSESSLKSVDDIQVSLTRQSRREGAIFARWGDSTARLGEITAKIDHGKPGPKPNGDQDSKKSELNRCGVSRNIATEAERTAARSPVREIVF